MTLSPVYLIEERALKSQNSDDCFANKGRDLSEKNSLFMLRFYMCSAYKPAINC